MADTIWLGLNHVADMEGKAICGAESCSPEWNDEANTCTKCAKELLAGANRHVETILSAINTFRIISAAMAQFQEGYNHHGNEDEAVQEGA